MAEKILSEEEAMAALGYNNPETPGSSDTSQVGLPAEEEQTPETAAQPPEVVEEPETEVTTSTQDDKGNLTPEEQQRRTWQSERDQFKAQNEMLQKQLQQAQLANQQLISTVQPLINKYQPQENKNSNSGPPKWDFIQDGYFDQEKFGEWLSKNNEYVVSQAATKTVELISKQDEEKTISSQLNELIKEFPEYRNPVTGQVDVEAVYRDVTGYTKSKSLLELMREAKGKKTTYVDTSAQVIEQNKQRTQSVVTSPSATSKKGKVPKNVQDMVNIFGTVDIPANMELE